MRKIIRVIAPVFLVAVLLCTSILPVYAESAGVAPCFTNCDNATVSFGIYQTGAELSASYTGMPDTFTYARLNVQFQKKTLGLFWTDVGEEHEVKNYERIGYFVVTQEISGSGTYRAVYKLRVYGNLGVVDVIEDTQEAIYNP